MANARNAFLIVVLLVASLVSTPANAGAQPVYRSAYGYIHDDTSTFATNLVPGEVVEVGVWLELLRDHPTVTLQYTGEIGTIIVSRTVTISAPSYTLVTEPITAEAIMAECIDGWIQVSDRILQRNDAGNFTIPINKRSNLAPCRWASTTVTPVPPVQSEQCGGNNDGIQIGRQAPGLSWDEGVWSGNSRTVTFSADPGYTLVGQSVFTFVDSGNCTVGPVDPPVQTYVCGANNDTFVLAPQPPNVILALDSTWRANQRIFHYVADADYTLDGPGEFIYIDQPNRMCASPLRTPPVVINTPPARPALPGIPIRPTPRGFPMPILTIVPTDISITQPPEDNGNIPVPETLASGAPNQSGTGQTAVMTLAPAVVIMGIVAAAWRHRDD